VVIVLLIKCTTPCIYYQEVIDKSKKPSTKLICNYLEEEIKNISESKIKDCKHFKSYNHLKQNKI
jgi:hypothetical protein